MHIDPLTWNATRGWRPSADRNDDAGLVLYFGGNEALSSGSWFEDLRSLYPQAYLLGCSTGGQIGAGELGDQDIAAVAVRFDSTRLRLAAQIVEDPARSRDYGAALGRQLAGVDLVAVFVLSDGLNVSGSELVVGLVATLGSTVRISGGLAGDGSRFCHTRVGVNEFPQSRRIAALGLYGSAVRVSYGCGGGWENFGIPRKVTRSEGNVLFELDGKPALDLYERYLGDEAAGMPGTALFYPLKVWDPAHPDRDVVRAVLAVDRQARSVTLAGDVVQGSRAQLMRGEFNRLVEGAAEAARQALSPPMTGPRLALVVSCIARRMLMGQRTEDEIQAVADLLGVDTVRLGFYSYGEIAPHATSGACELHNQTMTVTLISEA